MWKEEVVANFKEELRKAAKRHAQKNGVQTKIQNEHLLYATRFTA
jgi:hypothetical protein